MSPEVGELDEDAFAELLNEEPDEALTLLAEMTGATDERLRHLARQLAGRVMVQIAHTSVIGRRGVGRLRVQPASRATGDIDIDASLDAIVTARGTGRRPAVDELSVMAWDQPTVALSLVVDCSGSMKGERLAAASVAAAAVLFRYGGDSSVIAFSDRAIVLKAQDERRDADDVVGDLLRLRGHGTTDVGLALRAAHRQLDRSTAGRKIVVLMSDCRSTTGDAPFEEAGALDELNIVAPINDSVDAAHLAESVGGRWTEIDGPADAAAALVRVLGR